MIVASIAFGALAALWSVVAPLGEAPDEPAHLALVLHLADGEGYPAFDGLQNQVAIIRLCRTYAAATRACPREGEVVTRTSTRLHPVDEAPDKGSRPAWDDDGGSARVGQGNQMPQHPPLYYQAMASVLRVERAVLGGPWSLDRELALLRLANAALVAPLPLLAWWAVRRFGGSAEAALVAAVAPFGLPMLTHIGSTLNNDNLLTLLGAVLLALLAGVVRGDRSLRTAGAVGLVTGLALLTKAFAVVFPPVVAVAYLLGSREGDGAAEGAGWGERARAMVRPLAVAGGTTLLAAAWWYGGVRARTGSFTPSIEQDKYTAELAPPGFQPDLGAFVDELGTNLVVRTWGSFGWYSVRFPTWLAVALTVAVAAAVVAALVPRRAASGSTRGQRAWFLLPVALLGAFVVGRAWSIYAVSSRFQFIQGRYLFAGVVGVAALVGLGVARRLGAWGPMVVLAVGACVQAAALRQVLDVWWGGPGLGPRGQARALVAWSGWPGELVALLAVAAVASGLALVATLASEVARARAGEAGEVGSALP